MDLQQYIDEKFPKIICLQETWFKTENKSFLCGYQHPSARKDRDSRRGGGVCIFVANGLSYDIIPIVSELEAGMENWNQDHPERYSNFCGLYIKFQGHRKCSGPGEVDGKAGSLAPLPPPVI